MIDPMAGRKLPRERQSKILWTIPVVLLLLGVTGWFMTVQREQLRTVTFTIPPGTKAGQVTVEFPDEIILTVGVRDTIVIRNQDDNLHLFGPFAVAPHSTVTKRFNTQKGQYKLFLELINLYNHDNVYNYDVHGLTVDGQGVPHMIYGEEHWFHLMPSIGVSWSGIF